MSGKINVQLKILVTSVAGLLVLGGFLLLVLDMGTNPNEPSGRGMLLILLGFILASLPYWQGIIRALQRR